MIRKDVKITL